MSRDVPGLGAGQRAALVVSEVQNAWCHPAYDDSPLVRQNAERGIVDIALPTGAAEAVALGYTVVLAEDATAGGTAEIPQVQITMHLPLLATISCNADVIAALEPAASVA